jgi:hypothetical protein
MAGASPDMVVPVIVEGMFGDSNVQEAMVAAWLIRAIRLDAVRADSILEF